VGRVQHPAGGQVIIQVMDPWKQSWGREGLTLPVMVIMDSVV